MYHEDPTPFTSSKSQDILDFIPSKTSFILGFAAGILSLGTIGFLVLLSMVLNS